MTVGITAFALVGMLGVLPVAIQQSRTCVDETRGGQLARMVYATLQSEPYTAAQCFGSDEEAKLDLSTYDTQTDETKVVKLYASYAVTGAVNVVRATEPPLGSEYQLTLSFEKVMPETSATPAPGAVVSPRGSSVRLQIVQLNNQKATIFDGKQFIYRLRRDVGKL